jgi:hypothetical protein
MSEPIRNDAEFIRLESRVKRLEEKHDEALGAIKALTAKVDDLSKSVQKAAWVLVGGGGAVYFLISGNLQSILGMAGGA